MLDLLEAAFSLVNLPYTILLILVVLYWGLYILGAVGDDVLDFLGLDFDGDVDVDADVDVDGDVDAGANGMGSGLGALLHFFYLGELPVVLIFSILILFMWILAMLANRMLVNTQLWLSMVLFVPIFVAAAMLTKAVLTPFVPWLKQAFDQSSDVVEIIGKTCTITSLEATPEYGQAELPRPGAPVVLNVKTREGTTLRKGEEAIVYEHDEATSTYLVAKFDMNETHNQET